MVGGVGPVAARIAAGSPGRSRVAGRGSTCLGWSPAWVDDTGFVNATTVQMARTMLTRAFAAGVPAGWVTMNEAYGQSKSLRVFIARA